MSLWMDLYPIVSQDLRFSNILGQPGKYLFFFLLGPSIVSLHTQNIYPELKQMHHLSSFFFVPVLIWLQFEKLGCVKII